MLEIKQQKMLLLGWDGAWAEGSSQNLRMSAKSSLFMPAGGIPDINASKPFEAVV